MAQKDVDLCNKWESENRPRSWATSNSIQILITALTEMRANFSNDRLPTGANRAAFRTCFRKGFHEVYMADWKAMHPSLSKIRPKFFQSRLDALGRLFSDGAVLKDLRDPARWDEMMDIANFSMDQKQTFREQVCPFKFVPRSIRNT